MNRCAVAILALAICSAGTAAFAQQTTFQTYRCGDGTEFIVGFFGYDKRAHMQIDGRAVTLARRIALSGTRYSGGGVTLSITAMGATLKHGRRPVTACQMV